MRKKLNRPFLIAILNIKLASTKHFAMSKTGLKI